ncbi:Serine/threonine-protein kinase PrkC [Planctomyces sp. SH-PL14]|nr:Serine/threonine-protein kinase PrkC [Planctomyces sp. SH-PL14]
MPPHLAVMSDDRESRLAVALEELLGAPAHTPVDWNSVRHRHPDLVDELRELWGTAHLASHLADATDVFVPPSGSARPTSAANEPPTPMPGILGDYELQREIGRGGMGIVFQARQRSLNRPVALKMVLNPEFAGGEATARLRAEAASVAQLDHPNIVSVYEIGEDDRHRTYFSMQFIEGTTLAAKLQSGPLPSRAAAQLLVPVCRAVAHAHRKGVVHRDLKPSNILIDGSGKPFVTDFGLAKQVPLAAGAPSLPPHPPIRRTSLTGSGAILGTPGYMAPEQASQPGMTPTPAADVYSLGAVLYAMVTARPPVQAASPVDAILQLLEQEPAPPRLLNPGIDADLEMIILKSLQKPTDLRYESADELGDDLEAYLRNDPIQARSSRFTDVLSRMFRPTHHAVVLQNWGRLWMWHALVLWILCLATNAMQLEGVDSRLPYLALWILGLGTWAAAFWGLRHRAGPVTFVERQIAHIWAASMASSILLFVIEALLGLPVLKLSPVLGVISAAVFMAKAGILSGEFYLQSVALFATSLVMAAVPRWGVAIFGTVSALCFLIPGWRLQSRVSPDGSATEKSS